MDREREAWQNIKDNATSDYHYAEVYDATPTPKPNYITATIWTTIVAVLRCILRLPPLSLQREQRRGNFVSGCQPSRDGLRADHPTPKQRDICFEGRK